MKYVEALDIWDGDGIGIFMGGGISGCPDWQKEMRLLLSDSLVTKNEVLLNPRRANFPMNDPNASDEQIRWEYNNIKRADIVFFWFPCETLCPITLFELGIFCHSKRKVLVGCHPNYKRRIDIEIQMSLYRPDVKVVYSLVDLAEAVKESIFQWRPSV